MGVCSYLLVSFWFTRIAANQSSISAFLTNRVGDCFLSIGMIAILWTLGNLDYATVFSLAPYINTDLVTFIGVCLVIGAMAKSAQVGLHVWLPLAMEGKLKINPNCSYNRYLGGQLLYKIKTFISNIRAALYIITERFLLIYFKVTCNISSKFQNKKVGSVQTSSRGYGAQKTCSTFYSTPNARTVKGMKCAATLSKQFIKSLGTNSKISLIWVFDITKLSVNNGLVSGAPFNTKTACAKALKITRGTLTLYLDSNKVLYNKWIISSGELTKEQLSKYLISSDIWEVVTGELLGDGHISYDPANKPGYNGRLMFTFAADILHYVNYLKFNILAPICTPSSPTPWPNPKEGKEPTQYWFGSKSLPAITDLYYLWYKEIRGKWTKILPLNIEELLTPLALAHFIMGDGYFSEGSVFICTDNYSKDEVIRLIEILHIKFGIKATLKKRTNPGGSIRWRIRVSRLSIDKLVSLVRPFFIPEMLYKLGLKK